VSFIHPICDFAIENNGRFHFLLRFKKPMELRYAQELPSHFSARSKSPQEGSLLIHAFRWFSCFFLFN